MESGEFKKYARIILITVVVVVFLILILQNTASVDTKILFVTVTMPRAVLLAATFALGFILGFLMPRLIAWRREKSE